MTWVKKKIGPSVYNLTTLDDAEKVLTSGNKVVLGYLNSLVGVEHDQLAAASKAEDDVNFYQTVNPDVAKLFHVDPEAKRPALVLVKREAEKISHFGWFFKSMLWPLIVVVLFIWLCLLGVWVIMNLQMGSLLSLI